MEELEALSKQELIIKINELQILLDAFKEEKDNQELLNFPWVGNLGNWYWYVKSNHVLFNEAKIFALGYRKEEIPESVGFDFFTNKLHPDDYECVMENMRSHLYGKTPAYEVTYRIQTKDGQWIWFYDRGKITKYDAASKPELVAGIVFDITQQKRMEELLEEQNRQLLELSRTDSLTGLFNRRALNEKLDYEMRRAHRINSHLCLLILDIDLFKHVNDTYGHLMGDKILIRVAEILKGTVRDTDIVGRFGGEEFLIILPDCALSDGVKVAEKIRTTIAKLIFPSDLHITISGGIAEYADESIDKFIEQADQYLYRAKENGRNRIVSVAV
jgi:diguanylate cyclase (GGDEF)-like protein/PAS domain S-box-containing protein